ncbi:hypothetical protein ACFL5G_00430 [Candidatus Margulisiibacteriota bacterium]
MPLSEIQKKLLWVIVALLALFTGLVMYNTAQDIVMEKKRQEVIEQRKQAEAKLSPGTSVRTSRRRLFYTPKWEE